MFKSFALQVAGLIGLPIGGALAAGVGGAICGMSVSLVYVGLAMENR